VAISTWNVSAEQGAFRATLEVDLNASRVVAAEPDDYKAGYTSREFSLRLTVFWRRFVGREPTSLVIAQPWFSSREAIERWLLHEIDRSALRKMLGNGRLEDERADVAGEAIDRLILGLVDQLRKEPMQ
jgi:hypothetical protein